MQASHTQDTLANDMKPLAISVPEMAQRLGISTKKAYQLVRHPDFPAIKLDGRILVSAQGLERWFNAQMPTPNEGPNMGMHTDLNSEQPLAITLPAFARRYNIPYKRVLKLAETGELPTIRMDGCIQVLECELEPFFEKRIRAMGIASPSGFDSKGGE